MVRNDIKKEFGDYQTPGYFAVKVCNLLKDKLKISPAVVIDPTCGVGNFLKAALNVFDNVKEAVLQVNPDVVDVSSGVEKDTGAGKDREKTEKFIKNIRKEQEKNYG